MSVDVHFLFKLVDVVMAFLRTKIQLQQFQLQYNDFVCILQAKICKFNQKIMSKKNGKCTKRAGVKLNH